jgi:hypothetical protein
VYLRADEQPQLILAARQKAPRFTGSQPPVWSGQNLQGMAMHMITDRRWLIVAGMKEGDQQFEMPLDTVRLLGYSTGRMGHEIKLATEEYRIDIPIGNMYDSDEIDAVVDYVRRTRSSTDAPTGAAERDGSGEGSPEVDDQSEPTVERPLPEGAVMMAEGKNGQVTLFENKIRISRETIGILYKIQPVGQG